MTPASSPADTRTPSPPLRSVSPPPDSDRYPWVAMGVVLIGTLMVILDTTIVNVALPTIGAELHQRA
jgi:hypothetical protein